MSNNITNNLYERARGLVINEQVGSIPFLQIRLSIGYHTAEILIERLEEDGIVSSTTGTKARKVLIKK